MLVRDWLVPDLGWRFQVRPVTTEDEARILGEARNWCLDGLTGSQTLVTREQQLAWFRSWKSLEHLAYLYYVPSPHSMKMPCVGWSHIHFRDGFAWPSLGVIPAHRGQGYGREIVQHTMIACGGPALGSMLKKNKTIQKIDFELGWEVFDDYFDPERGEQILQVSYPWPPPFLKEAT